MKLPERKAELAMVIGDVAHDAQRLVTAGLLNHDPETLFEGLRQSAQIAGVEATQKTLVFRISQLIEEGEFYFINPDTGEPSPLI